MPVGRREKAVLEELQKHITQRIYPQFYINTPRSLCSDLDSDYKKVDGYVVVSPTKHLMIEVLENHHEGKNQSYIDIDRKIEIRKAFKHFSPEITVNLLEIWEDNWFKSKMRIHYINRLQEMCKVA
jgi:hypothetical protein